MNRRRFLAVLGLAPLAAKALPAERASYHVQLTTELPPVKWSLVDFAREGLGVQLDDWQVAVMEMPDANALLAELPWKGVP